MNQELDSLVRNLIDAHDVVDVVESLCRAIRSKQSLLARQGYDMEPDMLGENADLLEGIVGNMQPLDWRREPEGGYQSQDGLRVYHFDCLRPRVPSPDDPAENDPYPMLIAAPEKAAVMTYIQANDMQTGAVNECGTPLAHVDVVLDASGNVTKRNST